MSDAERLKGWANGVLANHDKLEQIGPLLGPVKWWCKAKNCGPHPCDARRGALMVLAAMDRELRGNLEFMGEPVIAVAMASHLPSEPAEGSKR